MAYSVRSVHHDVARAPLRHRLDVLLGPSLIQAFVPHPPGWVAVAQLSRTQDGEGDAGLLEHAGDRLADPLRPVVEGPGAAYPIEIFGSLPILQDGNAEILGPLCPAGLRLTPRIGGAFQVAQQRPDLGRE